MSDWVPVSPGSKLLTRNMSYIKPLSGSLGPKQTKCEIKNELVHADFDVYISTITTTRTPDVPSGGVFAVKTRTCVMWASPVSSKVLITTQIEWSGRSFIKGEILACLSRFNSTVKLLKWMDIFHVEYPRRYIRHSHHTNFNSLVMQFFFLVDLTNHPLMAFKGIIEKSAIDGQKQYHADLEKAMRTYIQEHQSEFLPEGVEAATIADIEEQEVVSAEGLSADESKDKHKPTLEELKQRERERNARGLQWAWDTFDGAYQVAKRSTKGALELVRDAWDQSTSTTILWFVIVILVFSNIWTLLRMGSNKAEALRKLEARKVEEREKWVQSIVTALWEEMAAGKVGPAVLLRSSEVVTAADVPTPSPVLDTEVPPQVSAPLQSIEDIEEDVRQLQNAIKVLEQRVIAVKQSLVSLENLD